MHEVLKSVTIHGEVGSLHQCVEAGNRKLLKEYIESVAKVRRPSSLFGEKAHVCQHALSPTCASPSCCQCGQRAHRAPTPVLAVAISTHAYRHRAWAVAGYLGRGHLPARASSVEPLRRK